MTLLMIKSMELEKIFEIMKTPGTNKAYAILSQIHALSKFVWNVCFAHSSAYVESVFHS